MSIGDWAEKSSKKLMLVQTDITIEMAHRKERYEELNQALYDVGYYTKDMDIESIQKTLVNFMSKEKNQVIKEKMEEALRG